MQNFENEEQFKAILDPEMTEFVQWCDADDLKIFLEEGCETKELMRVFYIALVLGFRVLALNIVANMDGQGLEDFVEAGSMTETSEKEAEQSQWISDFIAKQPDGKTRKYLMERCWKSARESEPPTGKNPCNPAR